MEDSNLLHKKIEFIFANGLLHLLGNEKVYNKTLNAVYGISSANNSGKVNLEELYDIYNISRRNGVVRYSIYTLYIYDCTRTNIKSYFERILKLSLLYNIVELIYIDERDDAFLFDDLYNLMHNLDNILITINTQNDIEKYSEYKKTTVVVNRPQGNQKFDNTIHYYLLDSIPENIIENTENKFIFTLKDLNIDFNYLMRLIMSSEYSKSIINFLNYRRSILNETAIITSQNKLVSQKNTSCNKCWAKNICWSTKIYWLLDTVPKKVIQNENNCNLIRAIIEEIMPLSSNTQSNKGNIISKTVDTNGYKIKLINP